MEYNITSVMCRLYDSDTIRRMSSVRINDTWDANDPRLGPDLIATQTCPSCNMGSKCQGHPGHLDLPGCIPNPLMVPSITSILSHTCSSCHLYQRNEHKKRCDSCGSDVDGITCIGISDEATSGASTDPIRASSMSRKGVHEVSRKRVTFAEARDILAGMSSERWTHVCFMDCIVVPPGVLRQLSDDRSKQSPLAVMYSNLVDIVRKSNDVVTIYKAYKDVICGQDAHDNNTVMSLMSGKSGVFRDMMVGKRVEECGRAVIVADDWIAPDEVRIPRRISNSIRVTVRVTDANVDGMRALASMGKLRIGSCHDAIVSDVRSKRSFTRGLENGDMVMLNRQPSLTKSSLMALKARISTDDSPVIGINTAVTPAYNADFDGDEMNVFFQDDLSSIAETKGLAYVGDCMISPGSSKPVVHPVQDSITCLFMLTRHVESVSKSVYDDIWTSIGGAHELKNAYDTRDLVSLCFPRDFHYSSPALSGGKVIIASGRLVEGVVTKSVLCSSDESILQVMRMTKSSTVVLSAIHRIQLLASSWTTRVAVGISMADITGAQTRDVMQCMTDEERGLWLSDPSSADMTRLAANMRSREEVLVSEIHSDTSTKLGTLDAIVASGAKGSVTNLVQIRRMVGQQFVLGDVPKLHNTQTGDVLVDRMRSCGLCTSSYMSGLDEVESICHQMAGREGVVRINVSTSVVGYQSRRFVKPMSSLKVAYNGAVMSHARIVRMSHGLYGMDPSLCMKGATVVTRNILNNI